MTPFEFFGLPETASEQEIDAKIKQRLASVQPGPAGGAQIQEVMSMANALLKRQAKAMPAGSQVSEPIKVPPAELEEGIDVSEEELQNIHVRMVKRQHEMIAARAVKEYKKAARVKAPPAKADHEAASPSTGGGGWSRPRFPFLANVARGGVKGAIRQSIANALNPGGGRGFGGGSNDGEVVRLLREILSEIRKMQSPAQAGPQPGGGFRPGGSTPLAKGASAIGNIAAQALAPRSVQPAKGGGSTIGSIVAGVARLITRT